MKEKRKGLMSRAEYSEHRAEQFGEMTLDEIIAETPNQSHQPVESRTVWSLQGLLIRGDHHCWSAIDLPFKTKSEAQEMKEFYESEKWDAWKGFRLTRVETQVFLEE